MGTRNPTESHPGETDRQSDRFQVLSLDGGGMRGIFTAAALAGLEEDLDRPIMAHFDLIVGTSTGGILALALGAGLSPREALEIYLDEGASIFPGPERWRSLRRFFTAKYTQESLARVARRVFGETLLGESNIPLVIPAYSLGENIPYLFKTPHHVRLKRDWRVPMWAVAMATSAAPTFFPAFKLPGSQIRLIDGGVWANNPAMVGVTEAVSSFARPLDAIRVLSLGTAADPRVRPERLDRGGVLQWVTGRSAVDVLVSGQGAGAIAQVELLLGPDHAHRLDPLLFEGAMPLDRVDVDLLIAKAAHHSRTFSPIFDREFSGHTPDPYRPCYGPKSKESTS